MNDAPTHPANGLSIIIPAYNEANGILPTLSALRDVLDDAPLDAYEIVVVDDGSKDGTSDALLAAPPEVVVLRHRRNKGYGAALKTGIRHARYPLVCITDADGTYPPQHIAELVAAQRAGGYDMVVGARTGENVNIPLLRRAPKWVLRQLASYVAGEPIPDMNSGLRLFPRDVVLRFFGLLPDGFSFTTTITLAMLTNGYLVHYVPINYLQRIGRSKIKPIRDTLNFTQLVLKIGLTFRPLKVFLPLGLGLLLLAVVWGLFTGLVLGRLADVTTLLLALAGLQIAVIGMMAEAINQRLPNTFANQPEDAPEVIRDGRA